MTVAKPKTRTLLVSTSTEGRFQIEIPGTARITYGLMHPGTKNARGYTESYTEGNVLRIYEGTTQTAVFRNVLSFRDVGYPMTVEVVKTEAEARAETEGGREVYADTTKRVEASWAQV